MSYKTYTIKKGKHYPKGIHIGLTFKNYICFKCKFDESCLYDLRSNDNYDINKLFGFSTTWFHHKQSARVGWRCLDGQTIEILTYSYNDSKREIGETDLLGTVKPNQEFTCTIIDEEDQYKYMFYSGNPDEKNSFVSKTDKKQKDWFPFHYILYPYFGGNNPTPHKMKIYIKRL